MSASATPQASGEPQPGASQPGAPALGISGRLTRSFIRSPLTPLILLAAFALGLLALVALPREEEPQISVPMVDISIRTDGLKADDAAPLPALSRRHALR